MSAPRRGGMSPLTVASLGLCLIAASVAFLDRPVADFVHAAPFHGAPALVWLTWIVDPVLPLAILCLAAAGVAAWYGRPPTPTMRVLLAAAVAALLATAIKDQLKFAFGRTWPETWVNGNPSWIGDHVYGFFPFHGGTGWASFPSGHTTLISAPMAVLWRGLPRFSAVWLALVLLVAIGLIGADYHFLGDVIAGGYLGFACGTGIAGLLLPPGPTASAPLPPPGPGA